MHDRSIFLFLQPFISFELSLSPPRSTKFYPGSEQALLCVVINIPHHPAVKINNPAHHALGKYLMQARGLQLKFCWLKVICCSLYVNQTNLIAKSSTKLGGQAGGQQKIWGAMAHPGPSLESPLVAAQKRLKTNGI